MPKARIIWNKEKVDASPEFMKVMKPISETQTLTHCSHKLEANIGTLNGG